MIEFTRTAHAVGQGGFYSECFESDEIIKFRLVYDCGSETLVPVSKSNKTNFSKIINSDLGKPANSSKNDIDVLVISHFHADHINGVEFLNPRYIILPLISEEQLIMLWAYSIIHDIDFAIGFETFLRERFPDAQIIKVKPIEDEEFPYLNDSNDDNSRVIESNEPLYNDISAPINNFWEYRFYNPNLSRFLAQFKRNLSIKGLDFNKLKGFGSKTYIELHKDDLKDAYASLKNINEHSLLMYSNIKKDKEYDFHLRLAYQSRNIITPRRNFCPLWWEIERNYPYFPGGFYWGDIAVTNTVQSKLHSFLSNLLPVGFIQIPHHGSHYNFKVSILDSTIYKVDQHSFCVIQVGMSNKHGHPSASVINKIVRKGDIPILVTEDRSSCFIQSFNIEI